jgi:hypothetical protein
LAADADLFLIGLIDSLLTNFRVVGQFWPRRRNLWVI